MFLTMTTEQRADARHVLEREYVPTLDRIQRDGLVDRLSMYCYVAGNEPGDILNDCGTTCCVAGWHAVFNGHTGTLYSQQADDWSCDSVYSITGQDTRGQRGLKAWNALFGTNRGYGLPALAKQNKAAALLLYRLDALDEYEQQMRLPKRERADHLSVEVPA